jgi:hypothetical protein
VEVARSRAHGGAAADCFPRGPFFLRPPAPVKDRGEAAFFFVTREGAAPWLCARAMAGGSNVIATYVDILSARY